METEWRELLPIRQRDAHSGPWINELIHKHLHIYCTLHPWVEWLSNKLICLALWGGLAPEGEKGGRRENNGKKRERRKEKEENGEKRRKREKKKKRRKRKERETIIRSCKLLRIASFWFSPNWSTVYQLNYFSQFFCNIFFIIFINRFCMHLCSRLMGWRI